MQKRCNTRSRTPTASEPKAQSTKQQSNQKQAMSERVGYVPLLLPERARRSLCRTLDLKPNVSLLDRLLGWGPSAARALLLASASSIAASSAGSLVASTGSICSSTHR